MNEIIRKDYCTGCTACYSICPVSCINMVCDEEGFLYPLKSDECINCGKCEKVCPRINPKEAYYSYQQRAFAACSNNYNIWKRSASGGAFTEICKAWENGDTLYAGAAWNGLHVQHVCVHGSQSVGIFSKSKYVASDLGDTFKQIKDNLDKGNRALFSGTPCQVAGLKAYLGQEYDNLLLVDLICHGVGSTTVFESCIHAIENQFGCNIREYGFRQKTKAYTQDHIEKIISEDSMEFLIENDQYIQLFTSQDCLRKSCGENCIYRDKRRQGDITIGDFKHLSDVFAELKGSKYNYSTIVINSDKGDRIFDALSRNMEMFECSVNVIEKYNPLFSSHTFFSNDRDEFFKEFKKNPAGTVEKWTKPAQLYKQNIKGRIFDLLPTKIRAKYIKRRKLIDGKE